MNFEKQDAINEILKRRSKNITWNSYPYNLYYRIWEGSTIMNDVEYKASYSIGIHTSDSVEMLARRIFKNVREDLAAQLFCRHD